MHSLEGVGSSGQSRWVNLFCLFGSASSLVSRVTSQMSFNGYLEVLAPKSHESSPHRWSLIL